MLFSNLLHLSLHHLVLVDKHIIGDRAVGVLLMLELGLLFDCKRCSVLVFMVMLRWNSLVRVYG
jgi:hypothetical protein